MPAAVDAAKPEIASDAQRRAWLTGRWLSEGVTKEGWRRTSLNERREDGTYEVEFRLLREDGRIWRNVELGLWGVSGDTYFTITQGWREPAGVERADPTDPHLYDAYRIEALDAAEFRYRQDATGNAYVARRVADDFALPPLQAVPPGD